jgi:hypothetical protein
MATAALGLDKVHSFLRGRECACAGSPVFSNDNPGIIPKRHVPFIMRPQALAALFPRHASISLRKTTSGVVSCDPAGTRDRTEFGEGPSGKRGVKALSCHAQLCTAGERWPIAESAYCGKPRGRDRDRLRALQLDMV